MYCKLCEENGIYNSFTEGCNNFRRSAMEDHTVTKDHRVCMQAFAQRDNNIEIQRRLLSVQEKGAVVAVRAAHWIVPENLALTKFRSLMELLRALETPNIETLHISESTGYDSSWAFIEFLKAMSTVVEEKIKNDMETAAVMTVLVDESTDITNKKRFAILVRTVNAGLEAVTHYLANVQVSDGTGETMARTIKDEFSKRGVDDFSKVKGLGTDGATAMTGLNKGLTGLLKRENPAIVNVHCIAHRLALCTSQAAEDLPSLKDYVDTLTSLFYYFQASPARCARMKEIQTILEAEKLKFREVHQVRWLSFYEAQETVNRNLLPLMTYYMESAEVTSRSQDPKAIGLKKKICTTKFLGLTAVLMDVILIISTLNLFFQKTEIDIGAIKEKIDNDFPNILKFVQCAVTMPVHAADVERTFSCQNRVCTGLRNALATATQDMLMRVYLEGPQSQQDMTDWVVEVVDRWSSARQRMLFTSIAKKDSTNSQ